MNPFSDFPPEGINLSYPDGYSQDFYQKLLETALAEAQKAHSPVMVCGPLHHGNKFQENYQLFIQYQNYLRSQKYSVFNQLNYLDRNLENAPFDFDTKFEIFYKGIIASKIITKFFFIPGWEESRGARTEKEFCQLLGLPTHELPLIL